MAAQKTDAYGAPHEIKEETAKPQRKTRKPSIPFTYTEATAYADMVKSLTDAAVGVQQDAQGQWGVAVETRIVRVKRLTTLNAVMKHIAKARQLNLEDTADTLSAHP